MAFSFALHDAAFSLANGQTLFSDINLTLKYRVNALVGVNGVGKSVLAQILAGRLPLANGKLTNNLHTAYIPQQWHGDPEDSVSHVLGLAAPLAAMARITNNQAQRNDFEIAEPWWDWQTRLRQVIADCALPEGIDLTRPIASFSGGEQFRLMWAAARLQQADLYILDEPTNHLDQQGRELLMAWLQSSQQYFFIVSHDRNLLEQVEAIYELTATQLHLHSGNYSQFIAAQRQRWHNQQQSVAETRKAEKRAAIKAQEAFEKQQQRTAQGKAKAQRENWTRLEKNAAKQAGEDNLKNQKSMREQRAHTRQGNRQQAENDREWFEPIGFELPDSALAAKSRVLSLQQLCAGFKSPLHQALSFNLQGAFRLHICGSNGAGKTALVRTLLGQQTAYSGHYQIHVPVAYLEQHFSGFNSQQCAVKNLLQLQPTLTEKQARDRLAWLRLRNTKADIAFGSLSGGEQLKVALAAKLLGAVTPKLLILDEPTNHLDLDSLIALEQALAKFQGAIIVISHDQSFVERLAISHRLYLPSGQLTAEI